MSLPPPQTSIRPGPRSDSLQPARLEIPRSSSGYSHEISPPDSPRTADGRSSSPNVSPITDGGGSRGPFGASGRTTGIPAPISSNNASGTSSYITGWREKVGSPVPRKDIKPTKWDKYSGEPTDSMRGREGQTLPGTNPYDRGPMGNSSVITGGQSQGSRSSLFSQTLRKVGKREASGSPATTQQPREEWKGASGRHAIVDAPSEKPHEKQKALPTPSQRRNRQGIRPSAGAGAKQANKQANKQASKPHLTSAFSSTSRTATKSASVSPPRETASEDNSDRPKRRIADEFTRDNRFAGWDGDKAVDYPGRTSSLPPSQVSSPITPSRQVHSNQGSTVGTPNQQESPAVGRSEFSASSYLEHEVSYSIRSIGLPEEPGSRFSATTYATTLPDSRPDTPEAHFIKGSPTPGPPPSVLHRKRPIPATVPYPTARSTVKTPSRKPTPSHATLSNPGDGDSMMGISPPTESPQPMPEEPPVEIDKVRALEAHITALHKRRANLSTVINELTNVAQPTSITYDRNSRTEIKKTVSGMTTELASVQKEIHDAGLKLHRALKKRDEEMNGEGSGLWVRRAGE